MKFQIRQVLVAGVTFITASCTPYAVNYGGRHFVVPRAEYARLGGAQACCSTFADVRFAPLPLETKFDVALEHGSPAFDFESGKSYFAAFEIPASLPALEMTIWMSLQPGLFHPAILLLDRDLKPTRLIDRDIPQGMYRTREDIVIHGTLLIEPKRLGERYLIVLTTDQLKDTTVRNPLEYQPSFVSTIPGLSPVEWRLRDTFYYGPTGRITILARGTQ